MDERVTDAFAALLQRLLRAYETLFLIARHFHPPRFTNLMEQIGAPDADLKAAREVTRETLSSLGEMSTALDAAGEAALKAFAALRELEDGSGDIRGAFRAFRFVPMGLEALY